MLEGIAKAMWLLLSGAFVFGAWSATLEFRVQDHSNRVGTLEEKWGRNQEKILDILSRMDERLKNLEQENHRR